MSTTDHSNPNVTGQKRKSRFDTDDNIEPERKKLNLEVTKAQLKIAEMSKLIGISLPGEKKAAYRPLLLDAQGREIDEQGNLVKNELLQPQKTLAANVAAASAATKLKKVNPYLAHRSSVPSATTSGPSQGQQPPQTTEAITKTEETLDSSAEIIVDERLPTNKRELKAKKSLQFLEAGHYIETAQKLQEKEEKKMIAGYASGRKQLEKAVLHGETATTTSSEEVNERPRQPSERPVGMTEEMFMLSQVPPPIDCSTNLQGGNMEWWDEFFLPKPRREMRKLSKVAQQEENDYELLAMVNNKTWKFIQHPLAVRSIGAAGSASFGEQSKSLPVIPMYLTKKERKKLRRSLRQEREKEKRDKMMLGLLAPAEPKFKLSNFMKLLGDQATADPSKVEMKVIQQIQKRLLNHEMRNQANRLTPAEKKQKKLKKLTTDLSQGGVHTALFRLTDFRCLKYRFQVDITAQQLLLSGLVVLCEEDIEEENGSGRGGGSGNEGVKGKKNLVIVEGGVKSLRKFTKLMLKRSVSSRLFLFGVTR
jgi:U4/U6 small nuclear ribonucleoprotein PRP3